MTSRRLLLGVNIDHVATIRQARGTRYPDPIQAAIEVEQAGADAVTLHLREDRRHIQERDVRYLKDILLTRMNLEMAVTEAMVSFAEEIQPADVCLVPEKREELTTEGGLDVISHFDRIRDAVQRLHTVGTKTSLFIDADLKQIEAAKETGAPVIEIHTGHYADCVDRVERDAEFERIQQAAQFADQIGFQVNAGHGLNYQNVAAIAAIPQFVELNIGHSIVARALFTGLQGAVKEIQVLMNQARQF
ncbi:MAG: pyridoxine 5'-phosphate synthase [Gammaproteobacteria bacterium]|nr:pyridoxine 5'-phosphate synthase [Gammaproteobacteria bacterium]MDH5729224.1 pyridoxine 5'-phosphate synthase [Gammaproteobacteria bacterium]